MNRDRHPQSAADHVPFVPGVLTRAQVAETARSIVAMQEADGAVPWTTGAHVDVWELVAVVGHAYQRATDPAVMYGYVLSRFHFKRPVGADKGKPVVAIDRGP